MVQLELPLRYRSESSGTLAGELQTRIEVKSATAAEVEELFAPMSESDVMYVTGLGWLRNER